MASLFSTATRPLIYKSLLLTSQKRFSNREAIHRYVEPRKFEKHMLAACEPYYKKDYRLDDEKCKSFNQKHHELHPLEVILSRELVENLKQSDFILVFQYNYTPFQSERSYKNTITHAGGIFQSLNNNIYREAFKILNLDSRACNLFQYCRHGLVTGKTEDLSKCVTVMKKMPQLILLCGLLNQRLFTMENINMVCSHPTLDGSRANLIAVLETPAINLAQYIEQHSREISKSE